MVEDFYAEDKTLEELNDLLKQNMTKTELNDLDTRKEIEKSNLSKY